MSSLAVSCYLTSRPDPQRGTCWAPDDPAVLRTWAESAQQCGMRALILHDRCPPEFRDRWTQRTGVEWRKCTWATKWSTNDERFPQYLRTIDAFPDVDWWLFTDLSDVEFFRNPFELMSDDHALYIQTETSTMGENTWMQAHWIASYGKRWPSSTAPVYNAGLFGGHRDVVRPFIERVVEELRAIHVRWTGDPEHRNVVEKFWQRNGPNANMSALNKATLRWLREEAEAGHPNANMTALNNAARTWVGRTVEKWDAHGMHADMPAVESVAQTEGLRIVTGHPLHTRFKDFEGADTGAYVRHK